MLFNDISAVIRQPSSEDEDGCRNIIKQHQKMEWLLVLTFILQVYARINIFNTTKNSNNKLSLHVKNKFKMN